MQRYFTGVAQYTAAAAVQHSTQLAAACQTQQSSCLIDHSKVLAEPRPILYHLYVYYWTTSHWTTEITTTDYYFRLLSTETIDFIIYTENPERCGALSAQKCFGIGVGEVYVMSGGIKCVFCVLIKGEVMSGDVAGVVRTRTNTGEQVARPGGQP